MKGLKLFKQMAAITLAGLMLVSLPLEADAAAKVTTKTNITTGYEYKWSTTSSTEGAIHVDFEEHGDYIANLKSGSSKLLTKVTYAYDYYSKSDYYSSENQPYATIGLYAKKNVTTTVTFDIYGANNVKKESKSVKVVAKKASDNYVSLVKSVKLNNKEITYGMLTTLKKGKLKVTLAKGYSLSKIEIGTYGKPTKNENSTSNSMTYKTVKNGSTITLGTRNYEYGYDGSSYSYWNKHILAPTVIRITVKNKKTKEVQAISYTINRLAL